MSSLKKRNQIGNATPPPGPPPSPPSAPAPGGGTPVVTLPLPTALEHAAGDFKKLFDDNGASYHRLGGQFALLNVMSSELRGKIFGVVAEALKNELLVLMR